MPKPHKTALVLPQEPSQERFYFYGKISLINLDLSKWKESVDTVRRGRTIFI